MWFALIITRHLLGHLRRNQFAIAAYRRSEKCNKRQIKGEKRKMEHMSNMKRKFKLGMHSYTLHLSGCGESWGFQSAGEIHAFERILTLDKLMELAVEEGIDVLHITLVDLDNDTSPEHLARVKALSEKLEVELELNISFDAPCDPRVNATIEDAIEIGSAIGAKLVKFSMDIRHPEKLSHSCMCPEVMGQLADIAMKLKAAIPLMEAHNMKIALENHCDAWADEVIWLVKEIGHPLVGACLDTMNAQNMTEGLRSAIEKLAPYAFCVHFCDTKIVTDPDGVHSYGCALGEGSIDLPKVMNTIRAVAPPELDTIDLEIEMPLSMYTLEEGRKAEYEAMRKSIAYLHDVLDVGIRGR